MEIVILSAATLVTALSDMKGLTQTQPVIAGAAAGLPSGAQAVLVCTLYCVEMTTLFWSAWWVPGMLVATKFGGVL